jgi:cellulose synthase/poly-beta-1,6-N-acetylglucosamine synthase-like glycosyltransferase
MKLLFWLSYFICIYSYAGYPLLLLTIPRQSQKKFYFEHQNPKISLIIAAYNEERRICDKLENTLAIDYPRGRCEIIVASDQSDDGTDEIVRSYADQGVKLSRTGSGKGKEIAQKAAIGLAAGDILVFSDAATMIEPDAIQRLMRYFEDPSIGAVSSEDRFVTPDGRVGGEGMYVRYEMWLRRLESQRAGLVGLSGSFFAARRDVCENWDTGVPSDFNTALNCARKGLVAVTAPDVHGYYKDISDPAREYARKRRTVLRGMMALFKLPELMNPLRYGMFAFQVISHKIARWLVPFFLPLLLVTSITEARGHWFYGVALVLQVFFYALVALGHWWPSTRQQGIVRIPYYFIQANVAIAHAWIDYLLGRRVTSWTPSER